MWFFVVVAVRASRRCPFDIRLRAAKEGRKSIKEGRTKDITPFGKEKRKDFQDVSICSRCRSFEKRPCVARNCVLS